MSDTPLELQRYNVMMPARDGTLLATDLYLPDGDGPFPTVVGRTPYGKNNPGFKALTSAANQRGFAFVIQDVRGRGDSEGKFTPYVNEGRDGYDAVEWIAEQEWSTDEVVMRGASYSARATWSVALERPPHLSAAVIAVSPSDPFVEFPTSSMTPMMIFWYRLTDGKVVQNPDGVDWMKVYETLPLTEMDIAAGFRSDLWREAISHTTFDEYQEAHSYQHRFDEIDIPILHISGWYDDEQIGTPLNYIGMTTNASSKKARKNQRLLMGPWGHAINTQQKLGEVDFGPQSLIDMEGYVADWLDSTLGRDTAKETPPVRIFVMGRNEWRDEQEWPLARTRFEDLFLHSDGNANSRFGDGTLTAEKPGAEEPEDVYIYDPARPVPFITEQESGQIGGPDDYSAIEQRGDVLCYSSEPLEDDLEVTGPVRLILHASSSSVDTDFAAKLVDVHPTGCCQRLCDGIIRTRFRESLRKPEMMEPGRVYEFTIDMWNTSQVFKKGHVIRVEISSSAFPKFDRNLNTGEDIATGTRMEQAENRVFHDLQRPSRLVLPIIPA